MKKLLQTYGEIIAEKTKTPVVAEDSLQYYKREFEQKYKREFERLGAFTGEADNLVFMKLRNDSGRTGWMNINKESMEAFLAWIKTSQPMKSATQLNADVTEDFTKDTEVTVIDDPETVAIEFNDKPIPPEVEAKLKKYLGNAFGYDEISKKKYIRLDPKKLKEDYYDTSIAIWDTENPDEIDIEFAEMPMEVARIFGVKFGNKFNPKTKKLRVKRNK